MTEKNLDINSLISTQEINVPVEKFKLIKKGSLQYITNLNGEIISNGYHDFELFIDNEEDPHIVGLIGVLGAGKYALQLPTDEHPFFKPSEESFHELEFRPDLGDRVVGTLGAMQYILNEFGQRISKGFHKFTMKDGKIYGQTGTSIQETILPEETSQKIKPVLELIESK